MSTLFSQEHYDLMKQFERQFKGERLDREDKSHWPKGHVYQDGRVNNLFLAFRCGAAYGAAIERSNTAAPAARAPSAPAAPVVTADAVRDALTIALDGLDEIALAGMSGTGMESEEGMRDWHARQAWKFIGIAARTKEAARAAMHSTGAAPRTATTT